MPGHNREILRGAGDCPPDLAPLVWFAVAGNFFGQPKQARDWTLRGFLAAQGSPVGLDIPDDKATREALARAASRLFAEPITALREHRLDAAALNTLLVPDLNADMLRWVDGTLTPRPIPSGLPPSPPSPRNSWGSIRAGDRGRRRRHGWRSAKRAGPPSGTASRNAMAPMRGSSKLLLRRGAGHSIFEGRDTYPGLNAKEEDELRKALSALAGATPDQATARLRELETQHARRRETVWARRGEARVAQALEHLAVVAGAPAIAAHDAAALAAAYLAEGWKTDWAAMRALDLARTGEDRQAVTAALRAVYLPWLDAGAVALQKLAAAGKVRFAEPKSPPAPPTRAVLLFVDGLRMDLAQQLAALLRAKGAVGDDKLCLVRLSDRDRDLQTAGEPGGGALGGRDRRPHPLLSRASRRKSPFC